MAIKKDGEFTKLVKATGRRIASEAKKSSEWYGQKFVDSTKKNPYNDVFTPASLPEIGRMYLFIYDPKWKDKLPVYDTYPLVIPIEYYSDGFLGLNLHYLPPLARAALLDQLQVLSTNNKYDTTTKLTISYEILKSYAVRFKSFENCVKRYLFGHVRSSFNLVHPKEWGRVVLLPLQRWVGKAPY